MPSGVGASRRAARIVLATIVAAVGLGIAAPTARAQEAPPGEIDIVKQVDAGSAAAFFNVSGPGDFNTSVTTPTATPGVPARSVLTSLELGTYTITENGTDGPYQLTDIECTGGDPVVNLGGQQVTITLSDEGDTAVTCTFSNTLAGAAIIGRKVVIGDTSTWTRPAQFHIICDFGEGGSIDNDIEPPIGPGGPGTYIIGQGGIPPGDCTISEIDTGSDAHVSVSMVMTNHGVPIATGTTSLSFTSHVGDDLVLTVTNLFPFGAPSERPEQGTTTVPGSTTSAPTTTIATTTTVPGGGETTTVAPTTTPSTTSAPAATEAPLPTTGSPTGGLIVAALVAMIAGLTLVSRTRRWVD